MTWTYAKFIEKYGKDCIKETEDEFNNIIAAEKEKARLKGKQFYFKLLWFHFKFGENYEKMMVVTYKKKPTVPTSERQKNKGEKAKEREANPETSSSNTEAMSIERLKEIINDSNLEFKEVGREGHFVDIVVRKKGTSRQTWFPVQMKATKEAVIPKFDTKRYNCPNEFKNTYERFNYYENMIVICHNVKIDEYLIIPPYSKGIKSGLDYDSKIAKKHYVKKEDIAKKINEYIEKYQELEKPFSDIQLLCNEKKKLEIKYIHKRQETLLKVFDMEELDNCAVDFEIDKIVKVQEKAVNHVNNRENSFEFTLQKKDGRDNYQQYSIDDNDFYWLNLADTNYFYVIPSKLMEKDGKIRHTLMLHKEFYPKNRGSKYTDTWTYGFRFDWTKPDDMLALWCIINDFKETI